MHRFLKTFQSVTLACVIGFCGCGREEGIRQGDGVTPGDVAGGQVATAQTVTVRGNVVRQLDARTFTMSGTAAIFANNLAVVSRTDLPVLTQGDEVEVTGTVQNVDHIEISRQTSWTFNPQVTIELTDVTGYLVADSVRVIARQ
jgi:hypothetical protein